MGHLCGCLDCKWPTDRNAALRVDHAVKHERFEELYADEWTDVQRGRWEAMRIVYAFEHTDALCLLPHHAMLESHFASGHRTNHYGTCERTSCAGLPAHAAGHA